MRRRSRWRTIKDIAMAQRLYRAAVKEPDKQNIRAQIKGAGTPGLHEIGIDQISLRKRYTCHIVVSDLIRHRPIDLGG